MKRIIPVVFAVLIMVSAASCGKDYKAYNEGIAAFRDGDYEKAVQSLLLAVSQGMDDPFVKADLALAYEKAGQKTKAQEYLNEAAEAEDDPAVLKRVGRYYMYADDPITALGYFSKSLRSPENEMTQADLETTAYAAQIEMRYGNYDEAVRLYNTVILQDYMVPEHQIMAGLCYLRMHQLEAACQYFDLAAAAESTPPEYFLIIYHALTDRGFTEEAEPYFEEGLSRCDSENGLSRGEYCADAYRIELASSEGLEGSSVGTMLAQAELLREKGDLDGAEEIYIEVIQRGESLEKIYNQYLILKAEQGDFDAAFRLLSFVQAGTDASAKEDAAWNEVLLYEMQYDYKTALAKIEAFMDRYYVTDTVWKEYLFLSRAASGY